MVIAIDGPAGSGKSSSAKRVAEILGFLYLDTGAMYRAVTLKALREGVAAEDDAGLARLVGRTEIAFSGKTSDTRILMDGEDVSDEIRGDEVTKNVSDYCARLPVRAALVEQQRRIAGKRSVVCEGRDIGTVVFPDADVKFYVVASVEARAKRRLRDFEGLGIKKTVEELVREIEIRDKKDSTRENSPLRRAEDAELVDTTGMSLDEQIEYMVRKVRAFGDMEK